MQIRVPYLENHLESGFISIDAEHISHIAFPADEKETAIVIFKHIGGLCNSQIRI